MICSENMLEYVYAGCYFETECLNELILAIGTEGIELHVNLKSAITQCVNKIKNENVYLNLKLLCKDEDIIPTLAIINSGAFDLKNKLYWINNHKNIPIIINEEVHDTMAFIVKNDIVMGSLESI